MRCVTLMRKIFDVDQCEDLTPEAFASYPSKLLFSWFSGFAWKGWRRLLQTEDLWTLNFPNRCRAIIPLWDKHWTRSAGQAQPRNKERQASILPTLIRCFGADFACSAVLTAISSVLQFASPLVVKLLIGSV